MENPGSLIGRALDLCLDHCMFEYRIGGSIFSDLSAVPIIYTRHKTEALSQSSDDASLFN